eukprot:GHUV01026075.1.p2 GENE.GHUV01026075.1~~GHUV01026075.1.p2  ORF type:complete len:108 (-),score=15.69 GHUV01026075.1:155-478(-)
MLHLTPGLNLLSTCLASSFCQLMLLKNGCFFTASAPAAPRRCAGSRWSRPFSRFRALEDLTETQQNAGAIYDRYQLSWHETGPERTGTTDALQCYRAVSLSVKQVGP